MRVILRAFSQVRKNGAPRRPKGDYAQRIEIFLGKEENK
jgi:hypothetical protein